jgi:sulfite reductase beta subunit-like hemoprotein
MTKKYPLSQETTNEIERFKTEIRRLEAGERDEVHFKRFRLNNGVYGIRGVKDEHMIRIKMPFGNLTADQLEVVALVAEKYTPLKLSHVTTRQAIQIHNVKRGDVPEVLRLLNESGLTTREACGNTVRNVSCDPLAGLPTNELFDPQPYADLVYRYFLRNPICQALPRKFKIAFEGCPDSDRARIGLHDMGFRAVVKTINGKTVRGFVTTVGGGLGAIPYPAKLLEAFTPVEDLLPTAEAVIRIFDRSGERRDRNRARIKFLVAKWGIEEFKKVFLEDRRIAAATSSGKYENFKLNWPEEKPPQVEGKMLAKTDDTGFDLWVSTNAIPQKHKGFNAVYVRCYLGDLSPEQAREVASISRDFGGGYLRTTITQNILMRWIPNDALKTVYTRLKKVGCALAHAQQIADITRCPGADTCNLAITHSKGLAIDLTEKVFQNGYAKDPVFKDITIKISGCTNSCGQHHIADIGFYGNSKNFEGKKVPHYQLLLGGRTAVDTDKVKFGIRAVQIPARRVHEVVARVLDLYKADQKGEAFAVWTDRKGPDYFKKELMALTTLDKSKDDPKVFEDLGDEGQTFKLEVGPGECAA